MPLPDFLIKKIPKHKNIRHIRSIINDPLLHTVCEEASCPNIGECFAQKTCTFMLLGDTCTRRCAFCGVNKGECAPVDPTEAERISAAVNKLGLTYVVITSVTRDDLPDGGAGHFANVINLLHITDYLLQIEVLIPDFQGNERSLLTVLEADPTVLNHNIETVPRLYPAVRPQAIYRRSLDLLARAKAAKTNIYTKSGFMVGLGETDEEVISTLNDLVKAGCDIATIGQYLPPSPLHPRPARYVRPEQFEQWGSLGDRLGIKVEAGPFVRSSYHAGKLVKK